MAEKFDCGKIHIILKKKASIFQQYESNASGSACHSVQRSRKSAFSKVNDALYEWYLVEVQKNILSWWSYTDRKSLLQIAELLNMTNFEASNSWLRHKRWIPLVKNPCGSLANYCDKQWQIQAALRFPQKPPFEIYFNPVSVNTLIEQSDQDSLIEQSDWKCYNYNSFIRNKLLCVRREEYGWWPFFWVWYQISGYRDVLLL